MTCKSWRALDWRCVHFVWIALPGATFSRQGIRSLLSIGWPCAPAKAVAPPCSLILTRAQRCTGISQGPWKSAQPHQTLCTLQGPKVWVCQRAMYEMWLQKLPPDLALLLKSFWIFEREISQEQNQKIRSHQLRNLRNRYLCIWSLASRVLEIKEKELMIKGEYKF